MSMVIRQQVTQEPYSDRNETLRLLGFGSYAAYLRSPLWKIVRERALEINGQRCRKCGGEAKQAHHAVYTREVLIGEDVRGIVPVCGGCHKLGSVTGRRSKARLVDGLRVKPLAETNVWLARADREVRSRHKHFWCECGSMRKKNHARCGACEKRRPHWGRA